MTQPLDGCLFRAASSGSGAFVVGTVVTGWLSPTGANAVDGRTLSYRAQSTNNAEWEIGSGVWTAATTTLTRVSVFYNSSTTGLSQGGAGTPISFSAAPQVGIVLLAEDICEVIASNRTYYVDAATGSNNNTGLTALTAFATIQYAVDFIVQKKYIANSIVVTIQVADGTYDELVLLSFITGGGRISLQGNSTTRAVIIKPTSAAVFGGVVSIDACERYSMHGFTLDTTNPTYAGHAGFYFFLCDFDFSNITIKMLTNSNRFAAICYNSQIASINFSLDAAGSQAAAVSLEKYSFWTNFGPSVVTGNPAFIYGFYLAEEFCDIYETLVTYSYGSTTGPRITLGVHSQYQTYIAQGEAFLPGDSHPSIDSTSSYSDGNLLVTALGAASVSHLPTVTDLPISGTSSIIRDTLNDTVKHYYNKGGVLTDLSIPPVVLFAGLPASPILGMMYTVTDSNTAVWGSAIAGLGGNSVLARWNGSNWTVVGK